MIKLRGGELNLNESKQPSQLFNLVVGRSNFKPSVREILRQHGKQTITNMYVVRSPINQALKALINIMNTKLNYKPNASHDELFHLFLHVRLANGSEWILEKNDDVNIEPFKGRKANDQVMQVNLRGRKYNLHDMLDRTITRVGLFRVMHYSPTNQNCQLFIHDLLNSNGLNTAQLDRFIMQDVRDLTNQFGKMILQAPIEIYKRVKTLFQGSGSIKLIY